MRKLNLILTALVVSLNVFCFGYDSSAQEPAIIVIINSDIGNGPRSLEAVPINGCVVSDTIYLAFASDLGEIEVILEESVQGVLLETSVNTSNLSAVIPFSGVAGEYHISFILQSGIVFEGRFDTN